MGDTKTMSVTPATSPAPYSPPPHKIVSRDPHVPHEDLTPMNLDNLFQVMRRPLRTKKKPDYFKPDSTIRKSRKARKGKAKAKAKARKTTARKGKPIKQDSDSDSDTVTWENHEQKPDSNSEDEELNG